MRYVSLPMYLVLRRTTTLITLVLEWAVQGRQASAKAWAAVAVLVMGTGEEIRSEMRDVRWNRCEME